MTNISNQKFAYFIYKLPETTMVFVDYTCKATITHVDLENPMGLIAFQKGKKKPTVIIDCYDVFNDDGLIEYLTEVVNDLAQNRCKDVHNFSRLPCPNLSEYLTNKMTNDCKFIFAPDFNARIDDANKQRESNEIQLAEHNHAMKIVEKFDIITK